MFESLKKRIDWVLFLAILPILGAGLITMSSFVGQNTFFEKQTISIVVALVIFFCASFVDPRFFKKPEVLMWLFGAGCSVLILLFILGSTFKGATSWFNFGSFAFQPTDLVKILVILILSKYFSRRHIEIAHLKHIFISGIYAFIPFILVFLQPDFGSAIIIFFIWLGMIMVSGVSKKHLLSIFLIGVTTFALMWVFVFKPYQKNRIMTFVNPMTDIRGAGYNAYQSTIAVGSGEISGKGVGYGTQSRLKFLPEYQTDFIFAAYAEEWGFLGVILLFLLFGVVIWRILVISMLGASNFEMLYGMGLAIYFMSHFIINVGMNIGLMPVTGITIPFMSYGGSHLVAEFLGLGILMGMRGYQRTTHRDNMRNEFLGI